MSVPEAVPGHVRRCRSKRSTRKHTDRKSGAQRLALDQAAAGETPESRYDARVWCAHRDVAKQSGTETNGQGPKEHYSALQV